MEAYVCAIINSNDPTSKRYRIINLTPNVRNPLTEISEEKLISILKSGVEMPGIALYDDRFITYYDQEISRVVPILNDGKRSTTDCTAIGIIYDNNGMNEIVTLSYKGEIKRQYLNSLSKNDRKHILNVKYVSTGIFYLNGYIPIIRDESDDLLILYTNGKVVRGLNLPKNLVPDDINSDRYYTEWIDKNEYMSETIQRKLPFRVKNDSLELDLSIEKGIINIPKDIGYAHIVDQTFSLTNYKIRIPCNLGQLDFDNCRFSDYTNIEFEFQEGRTSNLSIVGLDGYLNNTYTKSNILDILPETNVTISKAFNADIHKLNKFKNIKIIESSFINDIEEIPGDIIELPETLEKLVYSFNGITYLGQNRLKIVLPSSLKELNNSFENVDNIDFDFSKCINLSTMSNRSLTRCDIESLDLYNCEKLTSISNSIQLCNKLRYLRLPRFLARLDYQALNDLDSLKHLELPETMREIYGSLTSTNLDELVIHKSLDYYNASYIDNVIFEPRRNIDRSILSAFKYKSKCKITIQGAQVISSDAFSRIYLDNVVFPNDIEKIEQFAFQESYGKKLDMYNWDNVTKINNSTFYNSGLSEIALPKNTEKIDDKAFDECGGLSKIFVPLTASSLGNKIFNKAGVNASGGTIVYATKNSEISKYAKKCKLMVYEYDTDQEAYEAWAGLDKQSSEKDMLKAKILLTAVKDNIVNSFTRPEYINNVTELRHMYTRFIRSSFDDIILPLDTSKLSTVYKYEDLYKILRSKIPSAFNHYNPTIVGQARSQNELSNQFKLFSNMITKYSEPFKYFYKLENVEKLIDLVILRKSTNYTVEKLYQDNVSEITVLNFDIEKSRAMPNRLWFIRIGTNIVYVTMDTDLAPNKYITLNFVDGLNNTIKYNELIIEREKNADEKSKLFNVDAILNVGDVISIACNISKYETKLSNTRLPNEFAVSIRDTVLRSVAVIGGAATNTLTTAYLLNIFSGTLYKVESQTSTFRSLGNLHSLEEYKYFNIREKYKFEDWIRANSRVLNTIIMNNDGVLDRIKQLTEGDNYLIKLSNIEGAYDNFESCLEWEIGKILKQEKLNSMDKITTKFMIGVFSTPFFQKVDKTDEDIALYSRYREYTLKDNNKIIVYVNLGRRRPLNIVGYNYEYYMTINNQYDDRIYGNVGWVCGTTPDRILDLMAKCYDENNNCEKVEYIDTKPHKKEDFHVIWQSELVYGNGLVGICISKGSGGIYLFSTHASFRLVYRFRNLEDAVKVCRLLYDEVRKLNRYAMGRSFHSQINNLVLYRDLDDIQDNCGTAGRVYYYMMKGYPNGYKLIENDQALFDLVAKQKNSQ